MKIKSLIFAATAAMTALSATAADPYKVRAQFTEDENGAMVYIVNYDTKDKIDSILASQFSKELEKGITLRASSSVSGGFKVYSKDGSAYIDLSDEEITKLLYPYLSSSLKELF